MTTVHWKKVRTILERASELDPRQRAEYLRTACGADRELRCEIDELLVADSRAPRLEPPKAADVLRALSTEPQPPVRSDP